VEERRQHDRSEEILQAIRDTRKDVNDHRQEATLAIGNLRTEVATFRSNIEVRVKATEDYQKTDEKWARIHHLLLPLYAIGHGIAAHFGIRI
jgi:hypothetical protein